MRCSRSDCGRGVETTPACRVSECSTRGAPRGSPGVLLRTAMGYATVAGPPSRRNGRGEAHLPLRRLGIQWGGMATPAHQEILGPDEHDPPLRPVAPASRPPPHVPSSPGVRPVRSGRIGGSSRRLGLFFKVFLGDMSIWAVLSGVLAYEVVRRGLDSQHAIAGIVSGLIVAIAVSVGLKQIANRVVRLNRSALEISRGDLSKALPSERPSFLGADEVDELTVAISHMQENLRDLVRHIQNTSRAVSDSADEMQVSTGNVTASAEEIKESMDRIAKGADEQLGLVERASGLISGIATSIKSSANTAQAAAEAATATSTAEQISRLAQEISQRSQHAVAAMKEGIDELGQGREDLAQITLSLDEIVHATQAGTARVTAISHAAKEQLAGSDEMVKAIREIREVASSNAKSTEEVSRAIREQAVVTASIASASQELTNLSVELQTVVSRFRLE